MAAWRVPFARMHAWIASGDVHVLRDRAEIVGAVAVRWEDPEIWGADAEPAGYIHLLMVARRCASVGGLPMR